MQLSDCHPEILYRAHGVCRRCYAREYARQPRIKQQRHDRYMANRDKHRAQMKKWRLQFMLGPGNCAICNRAVPKLQRDHNHATGQMRAGLCPSCNLVLGLTYENPELLRKVVEYIEFWKTAGFPNGKYTRR